MRAYRIIFALLLGLALPLNFSQAASVCDSTAAVTCDPNHARACTCGSSTADQSPMTLKNTPEECRQSCQAASTGTGWYFRFQCTTPAGETYVAENCPVDPNAAAPVEEAKPIRAPIVPILNVPIPGFDQKEFSAVVKTSDGAVSVNFMAVYLNAVYKFLIIAAALCAVLMVTLAGFQWTTARGKAGEVQAAKDKIKNVLIGVTLLLCAVSIGTLIDPRTSRLQPLNLNSIDPITDINESGETEAGASPINISELASIGIDCQAGKSYADVARSMSGKVSYRMGGKLGAKPPFADGNKRDANGGYYKDYCPAGTICLDCSGYADLLAKCTNNSSFGASTSAIFSGSPEKADPNNCGNGAINGIVLNPGDVIGWSKAQIPSGSKTGSGHVLTYIGGGQVSDSHGSGRPAGTGVRITDLTSVCKSYAGTDHGLYVRRR